VRTRRAILPLVLVWLSGVLSLPGSAQIRTPPTLNDIWLQDTRTGTLDRVTVAPETGRESTAASISGDGRRVVFQSDADFRKEGIANGADNVWLYERNGRRLTRITAASAADRDSRNPVISTDGRVAVFESNADLLGTGVAANQVELWRYEIDSARLRRLTEAPATGGSSGGAALSADGSVVAFHSTVDFDAGRSLGNIVEIWLMEIAGGRKTRVTRTTAAGRRSLRPSIDAAGRRIAFDSSADLLNEGLTGGPHIWCYDAASSKLTRVTPPAGPARENEAARISSDGTKIVFHGDDDLLKEGRLDSIDEIWLYDIPSAKLRRLTSTWAPPRDASLNPVIHPDSQSPRFTADGRKVVFASDADFLGEGVPNGYPHVWVYDLATDRLSRIDTSAGSGSGAAPDATATTIALFRTPFDQVRAGRVAPAPAAAPRPTTLSADEVARDLDAFQRELETRWAYLKANGVDYRSAIDAVRSQAAKGMATETYALALQRIIAMFIDGHAGVSGVRLPPGFLPFLIEPSGDRFVAFLPDRSRFVDSDHPFIAQIDGRPIADWIEAAGPFSPQGSPQYRTRHALRQMRYLQFQRSVMGLGQRNNVAVDLVSRDGRQTRTVVLPVAAQGPVYGIWPERPSGVLEGDVGYLRIPSMSSDAVDEINTWMPKFRDTRGLIVDVRGNGGGSRDALRALFPFVMAADAEPRVANAATYRRHPEYGEDHLGGSRFMYRESWEGWTPDERRAIERFKESFGPEWTPPADEFSEWHYLVMSRRTNPAAFAYGKPVIVLLDEKSFSATDIFVSAFKGYPGVTLMGSPSGGGSARQVGVRLPVSGLSLRLASMASFQISGRLHDGHGTDPDVLVPPAPGYFLRGGEDNILRAALARLRQAPPS
jgi:Tol biopolymer transport system component